MDTEQIIKDLLEDHKVNKAHIDSDYSEGYYDGYNDAMVDLMNKLGIKHDEEIRNA